LLAHSQSGSPPAGATLQRLYATGSNDYAVQRVYAEHVETLLVWNFANGMATRP